MRIGGHPKMLRATLVALMLVASIVALNGLAIENDEPAPIDPSMENDEPVQDEPIMEDEEPEEDEPLEEDDEPEENDPEIKGEVTINGKSHVMHLKDNGKSGYIIYGGKHVPITISHGMATMTLHGQTIKFGVSIGHSTSTSTSSSSSSSSSTSYYYYIMWYGKQVQVHYAHGGKSGYFMWKGKKVTFTVGSGGVLSVKYGGKTKKVKVTKAHGHGHGHGHASGGHAAATKHCHFPFIYKHKKYSHCISAHHKGLWCGTTANYDKDKKWMNCPGKVKAKAPAKKHCHFPFIYKHKKYSHCISAHHKGLWCGTSANYDKDKKWMNCPGKVKAKAPAKKHCHFPFIYHGKKYSHCISAHHKGLWCGTTANYDKDNSKWMDCPAKLKAKAPAKKHCHFPFIYHGKKYSHCISAHHKGLWCGTTANYDKDNSKWMDCPAPKKKHCHFPFIYKGKKYSHCITAHHKGLWCATSANYDKDKSKWMDCKTKKGDEELPAEEDDEAEDEVEENGEDEPSNEETEEDEIVENEAADDETEEDEATE